MRPLAAGGLAAAFCSLLFAQTPDVGSGAPDPAIAFYFQQAYYRNGFNQLVSYPPIANVHSLGAGLVQEFNDAAKTAGVKLALIKANLSDIAPEGTIPVLQMQGAMYAYYSTLSNATVGFPVNDTTNCPGLNSPASTGNSCQYQILTKNYAIFVYKNALAGGQNFATRDPYYTKWTTFGGISGLGPANLAETTITSAKGNTATYQTFDQGAIVNITAGPLIGRISAVKEPVYDVYLANGGPTGTLGLPVGEELQQPNGHKRQSFEGGTIDYDPSQPGQPPVLLLPVSVVSLVPSTTSYRLNLGDTVTLKASPFAANGSALTGRTILWSSSNSQIVAVKANGDSATLQAIGGGAAVVTASTEGITSSPVNIFVIAPCCQVGDGAPTAAIQQAFQDVVARNRLKIALPAASPAARVGNGYVQMLQSTDNPPVAYLIAVADRTSSGALVTGALLTAYQTLGGPGGRLGYPLADATQGGRQSFENGALAGTPVQAVTGAILSKWAAAGYEAGVAGAPTGPAAPFQTLKVTSGLIQPFRNGSIAAIAAGNAPGSVFLVAGLISAAYTAAGGPAGDLGAPLSDETLVSGRRRQDFEGGYIDYAPGDSAANTVIRPRQPAITASPSTVVAGGTVHLSITGFANNAALRVSLTGQPDFTVSPAAGAYAWDVVVPTTAIAAVVTVKAVDSGSNAAAQAAYTIRPVSSVRFQLSVGAGDGQTSLPGSRAAQPLTITLKDDAGNPAAGVPVQFTASPGARIEGAAAVTNASGQASAYLRLPSQTSVALATATAGGQVVTFSARAQDGSLSNFPKLSQAVDIPLGSGTASIRQKGALLTAVASVIRYHQNRGELPSPNGLADPISLNALLGTLCVPDNQGGQICDGFVAPPGIASADAGEQLVNLWRVRNFVGGQVDVSQENPANLPDLLAAGSPIIVALSVTGPAGLLGSHFVVATGVASDGSILIADPSPVFAQTNLNGWLNGFSTQGAAVRATVAGALRLLPRTPASAGFTILAALAPDLESPAGSCGGVFGFPAIAAVPALTRTQSGSVYWQACDGSQPVYQLNFAATGVVSGIFTDLASPGRQNTVAASGPVSLSIARNSGVWTLLPLQLAVSQSGIVNAASFTADVAPGGLAAIFGSGFPPDPSRLQIRVGGVPATILAATPFQTNFVIPPGLPAGQQPIDVTGPGGTASLTLNVTAIAPELFTLGQQQAAALNQNGTVNSPQNPARRGETVVLFATGLGVTVAQDQYQVAQEPVSVSLNGRVLRPAFAGLTPGFIGLYQVNVAIPADLAPGLGVPVVLSQAGQQGVPANLSVQ